MHVFGEVDGAREEVLRFDCFDDVPHYHYGFSYIDQPMVPIDSAAVGDPLDWVCERIALRLPEMLKKARATDLCASCDGTRLAAVAEEIRLKARALTPGN